MPEIEQRGLVKSVTRKGLVLVAVVLTICVCLVWKEGMSAVVAAAGCLPAVPDYNQMIPLAKQLDWDQGMGKEIAAALNFMCSIFLAAPMTMPKGLPMALLASH